MALTNTTDRYRYIYGSTARKLDVKEAPVRKRRAGKRSAVRSAGSAARKPAEKRRTVEKQTVNSERQEAISRNRQRFLAFDFRFTVMVLLAVVIVAAGCFVFVDKTSQISNLSREVKQLKSEKAELLSKKAALESEIDNSLDLEEIQTYAENNLNMTYPSGSNVIYYVNDSTDYFRQYGSVDAEE